MPEKVADLPMITTRLPIELRDAMKALARRRRVSLNKVCVDAFEREVKSATNEVLSGETDA